MDRQAILEALQKHGLDTSTITDLIPDSFLAEILRNFDAKAGDKTADPAAPAPTPNPAPAQFDDQGGKLCDPDKDKDKDKMAAKFNERTIAQIVAEEVKKALKTGTQDSINELIRFKEESSYAQKKASVYSLIEQLVKEGRVPPVEAEAEKQTLLAMDATQIHKFSEDGKEVKCSLFDRTVRKLKARPALFAERFGSRDTPAGSESRKEWATATYEKFSETMGETSLAEFVAVVEKQDKGQFEDFKKQWTACGR